MEDNIGKKVINADTFFTKITYIHPYTSANSYGLYTNHHVYGMISPNDSNMVNIVGLKEFVDEIVQIRLQQAIQDLKMQISSAILYSSEEIYSDLFVKRVEG